MFHNIISSLKDMWNHVCKSEVAYPKLRHPNRVKMRKNHSDRLEFSFNKYHAFPKGEFVLREFLSLILSLVLSILHFIARSSNGVQSSSLCMLFTWTLTSITICIDSIPIFVVFISGPNTRRPHHSNIFLKEIKSCCMYVTIRSRVDG